MVWVFGGSRSHQSQVLGLGLPLESRVLLFRLADGCDNARAIARANNLNTKP